LEKPLKDIAIRIDPEYRATAIGAAILRRSKQVGAG
jgi:hypothetical protein